MYVTSADRFLSVTQTHPLAIVVQPAFEATQVKTLRAGQKLFCEGDKAEYVYQVLEGVLRTSKVLYNGRRQVLAFGYPDDVVGLSHDCRYHSNCEAITPTKVRVIHKNACSVESGNDPDLANNLLKLAVTEIINMQEHFIMLGRKSSAEKIASFLLVMALRVGQIENGKTCFQLPMCRMDIADFLGLTIETVSRTFSKLKRQGLIRLSTRHRVCICDLKLLRELADKED